jgi:hypothetical protein
MMDRERARTHIQAGMVTATLALFVFALAFYVTILYIN